MTTSSPKSHNFMALRGAPLDDMEIVEQFGLDPSVAYNSGIHEWQIKDMNDSNHQVYLDRGMSDAEANKEVSKKDRDARKMYKTLLAKNGMLK